MAARDLSKTFEEMESDELSYETSVPTDLTMSPEQSDGEAKHKKRQITKQLIEHKQLVHDMQLLKIELSQKNLIIENMKVESITRIEELEEKLNDVTHQKNLLTARLESELHIQQEEARRRQEATRAELEEVRQKQQTLEAANTRLREKAGDVRRSLRDLSLSEERFYELKSQSEDELSLRDYVAMRLFEVVKPLQSEIDQLRLRNKTLEDEMKTTSREFLELQEKYTEERQAHGELRVAYQKVTGVLVDTKARLSHDNYRLENYDSVKKERDNLEGDNLEVHRQLVSLELSHGNVTKERDDLHRELVAARQSLALLKQDKEYLNRQLTDASNRACLAEERLGHVQRMVDDAKRAREEMYEKYVDSREQYKSEYENKLREEMEQLRLRTNTEIDRLRTSSREMYERENRNLREARDMAISEKEKAQVSEREMHTKYEQLLNEYRSLQTSLDQRAGELKSDLKLKAFETERTQLLYEEAVRNLKDREMEVEKLEHKAEVLTKEYYAMQTSFEKRLAELEAALQERSMRLDAYDKLERELDDVVMQAAEVDNEAEAERVLFSYGYSANVPSNTKRRLQQSVQLARRVLQLERANTSLRAELEREKTKAKQLADELKNSNALLNHAQQPYGYLIESIRGRDAQLNTQKEHIGHLEEDLRELERERAELIRTKNQMSLDLERLLNQKEEMSVMKQVVLNLSTRRYGDKKTQSLDLARPKTAVAMTRSMFEPHEDSSVEKPGPIHLTKSDSAKHKPRAKATKHQGSKISRVYGMG